MKDIMSKLNIEIVDIEEIKESNYNSRIHSDAQVEKIANSIEEFGFVNPIIIDEGNEIIAGHGRYTAARYLKLKEVPTIRLTHLTEDKKRAFIIADNKIALSGEWDYDMLKEEFDTILKSEMNIDLFAGRSGYGENSDENLINVLTSARQTDTIGLAEMVTGLTVELSAINPDATTKLRDALKAASKPASN